MTVTGSFAQPAKDDIENAVPIIVGGGSVTKTWCGNQSFQAGEPMAHRQVLTDRYKQWNCMV